MTIGIDDLVKGLSAEGSQRAAGVVARGRKQTLTELLTAWLAELRWLEAGNVTSMDDYLALVLTRDAIERVMASVGEEDRDLIRGFIDPTDEVLQRLTRDDGGTALSHVFRVPDDRWYWRRTPFFD